MPNLLVPIGDHLFSADQLTKVLNETIPHVPEGKSGAAVAAMNADGVKVGVVISTKDGKWRVRGAFERDWSGDNKVAGDVMFAW